MHGASQTVNLLGWTGTSPRLGEVVCSTGIAKQEEKISTVCVNGNHGLGSS